MMRSAVAVAAFISTLFLSHASAFVSSALSRNMAKAAVSDASIRRSTALSMSGLTIYGHPGTRSPLVNWACLELGAPFKMGDLSRNPHPFGQMPCVTDQVEGEQLVTLFESGAILQYLNQYYSPSSLTRAQKAAITSWITWANASLDPICFLETPEGKVYDTGLRRSNRRIDQLNAMLEKQEYLVSEAGFTLADVAVSSYLLYVVQFFPDVALSGRWPHMARYMKDCASRPLYGQAFGANVQAYLVDKLAQDQPKKLFGMF